MPGFKPTRALVCLHKTLQIFSNTSETVFCSPVRPPTHNVAVDDLKLLIPLPLPARKANLSQHLAYTASLRQTIGNHHLGLTYILMLGP